MMPLRAIDILGLFVTPAVLCLPVALVISFVLHRIFDRIGLDRFVWNRALFDLSVLIAITALLILSLRFPAS